MSLRALSTKASTPHAFRPIARTPASRIIRSYASVSDPPPATPTSRSHKIVIVGGGSAGLTLSNQLLRSGSFSPQDIAVVDPATQHHYQPGWTLVGGGLADKDDLHKPLASLIDSKVRFYNEAVSNFSPEQNLLSLGTGGNLNYEHLVVCPGIKVDFTSIRGLASAVSDPHAPVSSIYSYDTCSKTSSQIANFKGGNALFTHPAGPVKCAGAPQKILWLALDAWKRAGLYNPSAPADSKTNIAFATAMGVMFGVPKYSARLEALRVERGVEGLFSHDLVGVEGNTAIFAKGGEGEEVRRNFDFLHATPKMGPHAFVKGSPLASGAGFVDVDDATLQHKTFPNVWSLGDASSLPTSKTAAAITSQAPVLVSNLLSTLSSPSSSLPGVYNGYTSCPLLTEYGKVMLAEFKYGGVPYETFGGLVDQGTPRRAFYHLKKDFFPWVYFQSMVKGTWAGPKGWMR